MPTTVTVKNVLHDHGTRTGQWSVEVGGVERSRHRKKDVAIRRARQAARGAAPAVLKIQDTRGHWRTEATYG